MRIWAVEVRSAIAVSRWVAKTDSIEGSDLSLAGVPPNASTTGPMLSFSVTAICLLLSQKRCRQPHAPAPKDLCAPKGYCGWNGFKCVGKTGIISKLSLEERLRCIFG